MADSNLNEPVTIQATRLDTSILPRNIFSQSYLLYVINQGADVGAIAGKANQAGQGAYDAQVKNDEQDVELADHDARITANTKAINLLEVRLTTAEGKIVVLRSDVDYLLDEVIDIQAHLVTVDKRLDDVENDVSDIKSDYVSKTVAEIVGPALGKIAGKIKNSAGDIYRSSVGMGSKSSKATLKKAAGAMDNKFIGGQRAIQDFADEVNPDFNAINAIRELELENYATPGMISNNPAVRALDNAVASLPGTEISEAHKRFITELGRKADEMITSFGGSLDKQLVSDRLADNFDKTISLLQNQSDNIYNKIAEKVPVRDRIEATNTLNFLEDFADDIGGIDELSPIMKRTLNRLDPNTLPTYGRLDLARKQVGQAIGKGSGPFKDEETGVLKKLYAAITDDQQAVAEKYGAGELWTLGKELVKKRKSIEDDAVTVLGRKLQQSAIPKVESAVVNMAKGNGGDFRQLMKSIPKDMRQEVALTSMNKAFTSYAKSPGQQLGVDGFVKWYNGMSRNGANMKALRDAIGTDASKRLDTIYQAAKAMNRLNTGKQYASSLVDQQVNNFLKEKGSLAKIYGIASKAAAAEGITSLSGLPGVGATGVITSALMSGKTSRIKAADALLSSPEFKSMLFRLQNAPVDRAEVRRAIERKLMQSGAFKRWEKTLSTDEAKTIARTGIITWLASDS